MDSEISHFKNLPANGLSHNGWEFPLPHLLYQQCNIRQSQFDLSPNRNRDLNTINMISTGDTNN